MARTLGSATGGWAALTWRVGLQSRDLLTLAVLAVLSLEVRAWSGWAVSPNVTQDEWFYATWAREIHLVLAGRSPLGMSDLAATHPLLGWVTGVVALATGVEELFVGRSVALGLNALTVPLIYLTLRLAGFTAPVGLITALALLLSPIVWSYSVTFLPENQLLFLELLVVATWILAVRRASVGGSFWVGALSGWLAVTKEHLWPLMLPGLGLMLMARPISPRSLLRFVAAYVVGALLTVSLLPALGLYPASSAVTQLLRLPGLVAAGLAPQDLPTPTPATDPAAAASPAREESEGDPFVRALLSESMVRTLLQDGPSLRVFSYGLGESLGPSLLLVLALGVLSGLATTFGVLARAQGAKRKRQAQDQWAAAWPTLALSSLSYLVLAAPLLIGAVLPTEAGLPRPGLLLSAGAAFALAYAVLKPKPLPGPTRDWTPMVALLGGMAAIAAFQLWFFTLRIVNTEYRVFDPVFPPLLAVAVAGLASLPVPALVALGLAVVLEALASSPYTGLTWILLGLAAVAVLFGARTGRRHWAPVVLLAIAALSTPLVVRPGLFLATPELLGQAAAFQGFPGDAFYRNDREGLFTASYLKARDELRGLFEPEDPILTNALQAGSWAASGRVQSFRNAVYLDYRPDVIEGYFTPNALLGNGLVGVVEFNRPLAKTYSQAASLGLARADSASTPPDGSAYPEVGRFIQAYRYFRSLPYMREVYREEDTHGNVLFYALRLERGVVRPVPAPFDSRRPALHTLEEGYLLVWEDARPEGGAAQLFAAQLSPKGRAVRSERRLVSTGQSAEAAVLAASDSGRLALAWTDRRSGQDEIYLAFLSPAGELGGERSFGPGQRPSLVATPRGYALAYERHLGEGNFELFFREVLPDGEPVAPPQRLTNASGASRDAQIVWTGHELALVWKDERHGNPEVYFARVDADGALRVTRVTETSSPSESPRLAWTGSAFGLSWMEEGSPRFLLMGPDGALLSEPASLGDGTGASLDMAWTGREFGVAWEDGREIRLTRLSGEGEVLGTAVVNPYAGNGSFTPSLVWDGGRYVVAWAEGTWGWTDIGLALVSEG